MLSLRVLFVLLATAMGAGAAPTVLYDGSTLPATQGWTRSIIGPAVESAPGSGTAQFQTATNSGASTGGSQEYRYVTTATDFIVSIRLAASSSSANQLDAAITFSAFGLPGGGNPGSDRASNLAILLNRIQWGDQGASYSLDATSFHEYALRYRAGTLDVFVDATYAAILAGTATPVLTRANPTHIPAPVTPGVIVFGDATTDPNYDSAFTVDYVHFLDLAGPYAQDDTVQIRGTTKINVLANDTAPASGTTKITAVSKPAKGKASISGGFVTYTPGTSFDGTDTFTYTLTANGLSSTATVTVSNPLLPLSGTYFQLATVQGIYPVGTVLATLSKTGAVTGKLVLDGKSYTLKGSTDFAGHFTQTFKRTPAGTPDLVITLNFAQSGAISRVSGQITGNTDTASIISTAVGLTALPAGIQAGTYTVELPPDGDSNHPRGTGYASATLSAKGLFKLKGKLADGTSFSTGGTLNKDWKISFSVPLYVKPKGYLAGILEFAAAPSRFDGTIGWKKPAPASVKPTTLFPQGFEVIIAPDGALYTLVTKTPALSYPSLKADLHLSGAGFTPADVPFSVTVTTSEKLTADLPNPTKAKASISRTTGLFTGSYVPPGQTKTVSFYGILHQTKNRAAGYFLGPTQSGTVTLVPH